MNRNQHKLDRNSYRCWSVNITTQQSVSGSDTVKTNDIHISARCLNFIHLHACHSAVSWFPSDLSLPITSWTNNSWHVNERLYSCWLRLCYPVDVAVLMSCILLSANIGFVRRETWLEREWSSAKNHFFYPLYRSGAHRETLHAPTYNSSWCWYNNKTDLSDILF